MDDYKQLQELNNNLNSALSEYKKRGRDYARAYTTYRKMLAKELLILKAGGMPVTIAYDIARGKEDIANAKEQEIITESLYDSCKEAINAYKLQIKIVQAHIDKEWSETK